MMHLEEVKDTLAALEVGFEDTHELFDSCAPCSHGPAGGESPRESNSHKRLQLERAALEQLFKLGGLVEHVQAQLGQLDRVAGGDRQPAREAVARLMVAARALDAATKGLEAVQQLHEDCEDCYCERCGDYRCACGEYRCRCGDCATRVAADNALTVIRPVHALFGSGEALTTPEAAPCTST